MGKEAKKPWGGLFNTKEGKDFLLQEARAERRGGVEGGAEADLSKWCSGVSGQKCGGEAARISRCSLASNPDRQNC